MDNKEDIKKPEIIYLDASYEEEAEKGYEQQRYWSAIGDLRKAHFPLGLRFLALFVGIIMGVFAAIACVGAIVWFAASLIALRQAAGFNTQAKKAWDLTCKCTTISFGCLLAVINPALGIGLVILYFMMTGQEMNDVFLKRFSSFTHHQN